MLNVYFDDHHVADLWLENKFYCFRYNGLDLPAISLTLPVREAPYQHDAAKAYFANLLPEGEARTAIEMRLGIARGDDYALLQRIGGDCTGAVRLRLTSLKCRSQQSPVLQIRSKTRPLPWLCPGLV